MTMSDYCRIHQVPLVFKRMNGGWTTVCPWCDAQGRYDKRNRQVGAHEVLGYPRTASQSGVVGYGGDTYNNETEERE